MKAEPQTRTRRAAAPEQGERDEAPRHPFGSGLPRWRLWLTRVAIFSVLFVLLMTTLTFLGNVVEQFFLVLYTE